MQDKLLTCQNCQNPFVYSAYEQQNRKKQNLPDPIYCPICESIKRSELKHPAKPSKVLRS